MNEIKSKTGLGVLNEMLTELSASTTTVAHMKGVSNAELEAVYTVGYGYYTSGKFDEAEKIFKFLTIFSHITPKYWLALGGVRQAKRNFADAIQAYSMAAMFDVERPKPHYFAAECALAMGDLDSAESGVVTLLEVAKAGTPENDAYRAKAEALKKRILAIRNGEAKA